MARSPGQIKQIIVHCSDSPDSQDVTAKDIDAWHKARGWTGIGYHAVIRRDGTVEKGREEHEIGAHVQGQNADSLGVCVIGRKDFAPIQILSLITLLKSWMRRYDIPFNRVKCHYEYDKQKTCPNINAEAIRKAVYDAKSSDT